MIGRRQAALGDPVAQRVAPLAARQARRSTLTRSAAPSRACASAGAGELLEQRARLGQMRGAAARRWRRPPASAAAAAAARAGADSCDRSAHRRCSGPRSTSAPRCARVALELRAATGSSGRSSRVPRHGRDRAHRGQSAHAAAAQQRQQHRLELILLMVRGEQQLRRCAGARASAA